MHFRTAVTNESGELTGVVSISDVLHFENLDDQEKSRISMDWSDYAEYVGYHVSDSHVQKMMQQASANCLVGQIMTHEVLCVDVNENITSIAKLMSSKHIHRIFVSEQKKLIGIVSSMDVIYAMAEHLPHRAEVESGNRPDRPAQLSHAVL